MSRLNQITKEFNIGFATAAEFLKSRFGVEVSLNEKITDEQYRAMAKEFYSDKVQHSVAVKRFPPRKKLTPRVKPGKDVYTEEEWRIVQSMEAELRSYKNLGCKSAISLKKKKAKMKEKWLSKNRNLGFYPEKGGFVHIVSVPFGGMNKKR